MSPNRPYRNLFLIFLLAIFIPVCAGAQTVTVSGDIKSVFSGTPPVDARVKICFKLTDANGQSLANPRVPSVGIIAQDSNCVNPVSGHWSTTLYGNDVINVGGVTGVTKYSVQFQLNNAYAHGADYILNTTDSPVDLNTKSDISVAPTPTPANADTIYLRKDAGNMPVASLAVTAGATVGGAFSAGSFTNNLSAFAATTSAQLLGIINDETGSGLLVGNTSPTLVTPVLGAATATSLNKVAITAPATSATLTLINGTTVTGPATTDTLVGKATIDILTNKTLVGAASGNAVNLAPGCAPQDLNGPITGDSTDKTIYTCNLTANVLAAGKCLVISAGGVNGNAIATTYKIFFGATAVWTGTTNASTDNVWAEVRLCNNVGSQAAQHTRSMGFSAATLVGNLFTSPAENTTGVIVVKFTANVAASNTFSGKFWEVTLDQ